MPYCTLDDLKKSIPEANIIQLTDDTGTGGAIDQTKVDEAIAYAGQLIDGYLRGRYSLPLNPVPELIKHLSVDLAVFHLYSRRFELEMPESMMAKYKNAIKLLEQIQKGLVTLGIETEDKGHSAGTYKGNKTAEDRIFSKSRLNQF